MNQSIHNIYIIDKSTSTNRIYKNNITDTRRVAIYDIFNIIIKSIYKKAKNQHIITFNHNSKIIATNINNIITSNKSNIINTNKKNMDVIIDMINKNSNFGGTDITSYFDNLISLLKNINKGIINIILLTDYDKNYDEMKINNLYNRYSLLYNDITKLNLIPYNKSIHFDVIQINNDGYYMSENKKSNNYDNQYCSFFDVIVNKQNGLYTHDYKKYIHSYNNRITCFNKYNIYFNNLNNFTDIFIKFH